MTLGELGVFAFLFISLYFEVFLLVTFFERVPGKKTSTRPSSFPSVAIIIPCWNEERTLAATLNSLLSIDYPRKKLSVLVVNDGSTDGTLAIAKRFEKSGRVRVISKENGGKHTALNIGIRESESELVGCLDADSFVAKDALLEIVKTFERAQGTMAVIPAMHVHGPRNPLELMQAVEYLFGIFTKRMLGTLGAISVLPGPFSIYRREVFTHAGHFRKAHNTEDMEMAFRMQEKGLHIENAHTAIVYTKVPRTLRALIKQRTRWSQGFLQNMYDYRHLLGHRFGHFGGLVLPFGLAAFLGAIYTALFTLWSASSALVEYSLSKYASQVPFTLPSMHIDWFYLNTSMLMFLSLVLLFATLASITIGRRLAREGALSPASLLSYFALYGFLAPVWLVRALWGAVRVKEGSWR